MVALTFECLGAGADRYAATPTLTFALTVSESTGADVYSIGLRCQIRIEPQRRRYSASEAEGLSDLFGDVSRWSDTLKPIQFATVPVMVGAFSGATQVDLDVPCTYDLEVAAARYFYALRDDEVPLLLLFSGTILTRSGDPPRVAAEQVPWSAECRYRLPVAVWREMVDRHFPGRGWLGLSRDTIDALGAYKSSAGLPTWDAAITALLGDRSAEVVSR